MVGTVEEGSGVVLSGWCVGILYLVHLQFYQTQQPNIRSADAREEKWFIIQKLNRRLKLAQWKNIMKTTSTTMTTMMMLIREM